MRWGFIGAGGIARSSVGPAVRAAEGSSIYAVASRDRDRARALGPDVVYERYADLLDDPRVDVVYVALHNSAHHRWVQRALSAGKHVLCEKPLGLTRTEVATMAETAHANGLLLVEAAWNRWHPRTRHVEELIATGSLGTIEHAISRFEGRAPRPGDYRFDPQLGGGALYDVGCYAIAAVLSAFGWDTPHAVESTMRRWSPAGADEATRVHLAFGNGGVAEVEATLTGGASEVLTIRGSKGVISLTDPAFTAGRQPASLHGSTSAGEIAVTYDAVDPYRLMVEEVARAVRDGSGWIVPLSQSLAVASVIDQVRVGAVPPISPC